MPARVCPCSTRNGRETRSWHMQFWRQSRRSFRSCWTLDVWQRHKVYTGEEIAAALSKASAPQEPLVPRSPTLPPPADRHVTGPPLGDGALLPTPLLPTPVSVPTQPARTVVDTQLDRTCVSYVAVFPVIAVTVLWSFGISGRSCSSCLSLTAL
jgi:hypothetical protein